MIGTERKPFDEVRVALKGFEALVIIGCA